MIVLRVRQQLSDPVHFAMVEELHYGGGIMIRSHDGPENHIKNRYTPIFGSD